MRAVWGSLILIGMILLLLLAMPFWAAYQAQAGAAEALEQARLSTQPADIERAVTLAEAAQRKNPANAQVHLRLAEAYRLAGDLAAAHAATVAAYRLQPDSLLVRQALARSYEQQGNQEKARRLWLQAGVTVPQMITAGDGYLQAGQYAEAIDWYEQALNYGQNLAADVAFRYAVAATLEGRADAAALWSSVQELDPSFEIYPLQQQLQLPGAALRWVSHFPDTGITYGTPLSYLVSEPGIGVFWWNGSAIVLVDAEQSGDYTLQLQLQHSLPPPVELAVRINGQATHSIVLNRGDGSWETKSQRIWLAEGLNIVQIDYLNDGTVSGQDRNAQLQWLELILL